MQGERERYLTEYGNGMVGSAGCWMRSCGKATHKRGYRQPTFPSPPQADALTWPSGSGLLSALLSWVNTEPRDSVPHAVIKICHSNNAERRSNEVGLSGL